MLLSITPTRMISEVQDEFNAMFPFLKIEFFNNRSNGRSDFSAKKIIPSNRKIGDIQLAIADGNIDVRPDMKVADLEQQFSDLFGLGVQVFRRSGNLWLETTMTESWTLQQQNNHGIEITTGHVTIPEADDYDLTRDADH
jgi:hypothetical protein